jgi:adenosylcobinamide kinase / adenosylcobinamide-phosphate guanylyltransferase
MALELILGGARSGKSRLGEERAKNSSLKVTYVATGEPGDQEMAQRIRHHQKSRPSHWGLVEEPLYLAKAIEQNAQDGHLLLVDCLTLWLSNLLFHKNGATLWPQEKKKLLELLPTLTSPVILVGNETGLGVVPMGEVSRRFVDEAGWLHQDLAQICDKVIFTVAGLPMVLKGEQG